MAETTGPIKSDVFRTLGVQGDKDPEADHSREDDALWLFVMLCTDGTLDDIREAAKALHAWDMNHKERTRWCA